MKKQKWVLGFLLCLMALAVVLTGCDLNTGGSSQTEVIVTNNTTIVMSVALYNTDLREGYRDYRPSPGEKATWSWDNPPIGDTLRLELFPDNSNTQRPTIQFVLEKGKNNFSARYSGTSGQIIIERVR